jgi:hypothetical protein
MLPALIGDERFGGRFKSTRILVSANKERRQKKRLGVALVNAAA